MRLSIRSAALLLATGVNFGAAFLPNSLGNPRHGSSLSMVASVPKVANGSTSPFPADNQEWSPSSWKNRVAKQMPIYDNPEELDAAIKTLDRVAPLVFAGEVRSLHEKLARVSQGQGFVLMGGDCAESFKEFHVNHIRDTFRVIMQMALVMTFGSAMPVVKIGRMAGQFAKPRSEPNEVIDGARRNDPFLMVDAYHQSAQTLNILRAFSTGGFADISRLHAWNLDFVENTDEGSRYRLLAAKVDESLRFMKAIGIDTSKPEFTTVDFYTAHECLLLPYEQALTRQDSITGKWYDCSAHMLWVGERTRDLDGAHLEYTRGIGNPLGVTISHECTPDELIRIIETMNPKNIPGKLSIIVRMGAEKLRKNLPGLIRAVQREGKAVVWISDPVYANARTTVKARDFDNVHAELVAFFDVHDEMGSHPGGVLVEMTGENIIECTSGASHVTDESPRHRYNTACDPRLNGSQALELAFLIAERMRLRSGLPPL